MSQEDLLAVTTRFRVDTKFVGALLRDFERAIRENGYSLSDDEVNKAKAAFHDVKTEIGPTSAAAPSSLAQTFQQPSSVYLEQLRSAQAKRMIDLGEYTVSILKQTLNSAKLTYQLITVMNGVMFTMGVGLFLFAAIYGAVSRNLTLTAAFAGLGTASFIALFLLGPIDKTQDALSNLIQAEVAFMNYFEQLTFLETFAQIPALGSGLLSSENIEKASGLLQRRTEETVALLQAYLEKQTASENPKAQKGRLSKSKATPTAHVPSSEMLPQIEHRKTRTS